MNFFRINSLASIATLLAFAIACKARSFTHSQKKEFVSEGGLQDRTDDDANLRLTMLGRALSKNGIDYNDVVESMGWRFQRGSNIEDSKPVETRKFEEVTISLKPLSKKTCEVVRMALADGWQEGLSGVKCLDGINKYEYADFLPPLAQVALGRNFKSELLGGGLQLMDNCWGTSYELGRRDPKSLFVSIPEPADFTAELDKISENLTAGESENGVAGYSDLDHVIDMAAQKMFQFGDIIVFYWINNGKIQNAAHAAMFFDHSLVFQKITNFQPYNLSTLKKLTVYYDGKMPVRVYRPKSSLPHYSTLATKVPYREFTLKPSGKPQGGSTVDLPAVEVTKVDPGKFTSDRNSASVVVGVNGLPSEVMNTKGERVIFSAPQSGHIYDAVSASLCGRYVISAFKNTENTDSDFVRVLWLPETSRAKSADERATCREIEGRFGRSAK